MGLSAWTAPMSGIPLSRGWCSQCSHLSGGVIWELKSGSVPFIFWDHRLGALQIITVLLIVRCSTLVSNYEPLCGAVDTVFLVHFLRQMQILCSHSYLGRSQVGFPVQTVSSKYEPAKLLVLHPLGAFLSFWRDNWRRTRIWGKLCVCIKDSAGIWGASNPHETLNILAEMSLKMGFFLILRNCLLFYFIKQDEGSAFP